MSGTASFNEGTTSEHLFDTAFTIDESSGEAVTDRLIVTRNDSDWLDESHSVSGTVTQGSMSGEGLDSAGSGWSSTLNVSIGEASEDGPTDFVSATYNTYDWADRFQFLSGSKTVGHSGGSISGTEHDNTTSGHNVAFDISNTVESGSETQTGSFTSTSYGTSDVGYSVSGSITGGDSGEGDSLTGNAHENENATVTSNSTVIFTMNDSGDWDLDEATSFLGVTITAGAGQDLSGSYTSGQISGTQGDGSFFTYTSTTNLHGSGTPAGGDGDGDEKSLDDPHYDETADDDQDEDPFALDWSYSGDGSTLLIAGANGHTSAAGPVTSGVMSGDASQWSNYLVTSNRSTELVYDPGDPDDQSGGGGGSWETVGGTGGGTVIASGGSTSSMMGNDDSGDITLTLTDSSNSGYTYNEFTDETYNNGSWDQTGSKTTTANFDGADSVSGNGTYQSGELTMTLVVNDGSNYRRNQMGQVSWMGKPRSAPE